MPRYLLDSCVIADFQNGGALAALVDAATIAPMAVVDEVYGEMAIAAPNASPAMVGKTRAAKRLLDRAAIEVVEILPGTPEEALFVRLCGGTAKSHDRGEAASIAVAVQDLELVFVTGYRNGTLSALNELHGSGERVLRIPVFVRRLHALGALQADAVHAVAPYAVSHGIVPSWWANWLASLPRPAGA